MEESSDRNESSNLKGRRAAASPSWALALGAAVLAAGVGLAGVALGQSGGSGRGGSAELTAARTGVSPAATITVSASGRVEGRPDTVSFQVGVDTTAPTATAALAEDNSRMRGLEASLLDNGVSRSGLQTSGLSIYANTDNKGVVTGFSVDDELDVTMHDVSRAGAAIQAAANAAGNGIQLYGIDFSISNKAGLLSAARAAAMRDARIEAAQYAAGAGASLGEVLKVTTTASSPPVSYPVAFGLAQGPGSSVPLQRGSQPVSVRVTVTYQLR